MELDYEAVAYALPRDSYVFACAALALWDLAAVQSLSSLQADDFTHLPDSSAAAGKLSGKRCWCPYEHL